MTTGEGRIHYSEAMTVVSEQRTELGESSYFSDVKDGAAFGGRMMAEMRIGKGVAGGGEKNSPGRETAAVVGGSENIK